MTGCLILTGGVLERSSRFSLSLKPCNRVFPPVTITDPNKPWSKQKVHYVHFHVKHRSLINYKSTCSFKHVFSLLWVDISLHKSFIILRVIKGKLKSREVHTSKGTNIPTIQMLHCKLLQWSELSIDCASLSLVRLFTCLYTLSMTNLQVQFNLHFHAFHSVRITTYK